jgi:chromosomal replication initiator protein
MPALHLVTKDMVVIGKIKEALIQRIGVERFGLWFQRGVQFRIQSGAVVVEVAGEFALQRLRANFFRQIESASAQAMGALVSVSMELAPAVAEPIEPIVAIQDPVADAPNHPQPQSSKALTHTVRVGRVFANRGKVSAETGGPVRIGTLRTVAIDARSSRSETEGENCPTVGSGEPLLNSGELENTRPKGDALTFANFAAGTSNQLAHTAAQMLSAQPSDAAPLCFWGATGTGKTHLLNAIRHELRHRHRMQRVILLSAEDFTNDFLTAVRGAGLPAFRKRYRDVDALLIDNIQFFGGKSATLREMLYTVDTIVSRRRPLVLAGDRPPMEIEGLSGELAGRMSSGLVCGLSPLEIEVRRELLRRESMRSFMPWDDELINALASRVSGDGRLIQGIGRLVSMLQRMHRRMPTMQEIVREAGDMLQRGPRVVALSDIERAVCAAFSLPAGELRGDGKSRNISQPRILAMYLARQHTSAAFSEIGRYFGDRNHSTVIAAYRRAEAWLTTNQCVGGRGPHGLKVQEAIDTVENLLRIG